MSLTDCIVCGGRRYLDQRGMPACEPCEPMFAAHVVSMRTAPGEALAVCPCGWVSRHPWSEEGQLDREAAVVAHWRLAAKARGLTEHQRACLEYAAQANRPTATFWFRHYAKPSCKDTDHARKVLGSLRRLGLMEGIVGSQGDRVRWWRITDTGRAYAQSLKSAGDAA